PDPVAAAARLERAIDARHRLAPGRRVRALDWDNVGTVLALHDNHGTATVRWVAEDGATAHRVLAWSELKPIDHPEPTPLTPEAQAWRAADGRPPDAPAEQGRRAPGHAAVDPQERRQLPAAPDPPTRKVARQLPADNPAWLPWWVGARPADPAG